jgi:outer membrane assembly lipoprotein YfiO
MRLTARHVFLCVILLSFWGCVQKSAKLQKSIVPPDKTLFETGSDFLKKSQYIKARLTFQTLMSTYPDSDLAPDAVLAVGDSYYDEGGTENLLQAEDKYKDFITFFPTNPKAAEAQLKIIALNLKMKHAPDRDQHYTYKAEEAAKRFLAQFPDSDFVPIVKQSLLDIQENLALQDLGVGKYYHDKGNYAGARGRFDEVIKKYPSFSQMDEVLALLASGQIKSNNPEEAAITYGRILSAYPFSKHAEEAKAYLNSVGKPLPPVDTTLAAYNKARVKPSEGFSLLKPFIDLGTAFGFVGPPDLFQQAQKAKQEEKAKTAEAAARSTESGQAGSDIQIQSIIRKKADGTTEDTTVLASSSTSAQPNGEEKKKEPSKKRKRTKKTS